MRLTIKSTRPHQVIDITDNIQVPLSPGASGAVLVSALHTTCGLTTADLDPGTELDLLDFLKAITPSLKWWHPHDPSHAPAHLYRH